MIEECPGCERCFLITDKLELHHKHYDTLGNEQDSDLEVLCEACHKVADEERRQELEEVYYEQRLDAWATKVYGDDWGYYQAFDDVADKFESWLERKNY